MAPARRRRITVLLLVFGVLLAAVVAMAWLTADDPDTTGGAVADAPSTTAAANRAGSSPATTAPGGTSAQPGTAAGDAGGETGTSGPPAPPAPACASVMTEAEAAAALGAPVARLESQDGFLVRSCTFWTHSNRYLLVQVHRGVAASRDQYELSRLPNDRTVAGIGQAARWTPDTGLLDVLDGPARFQVGLFDPAGAPEAAEPPPRLETAARAIAAHL